MKPEYESIAVYEQEGTPEDMMESFARLAGTGVLSFSPAIDKERFTECVYRPLTNKHRVNI